jgi:hypothetical protein
MFLFDKFTKFKKKLLPFGHGKERPSTNLEHSATTSQRAGFQRHQTPTDQSSETRF